MNYQFLRFPIIKSCDKQECFNGVLLFQMVLIMFSRDYLLTNHRKESLKKIFFFFNQDKYFTD